MENFTTIINGIKTKEDFIHFVELLNLDLKKNPDKWENKNVSDYLDGISRWTSDMVGYYKYMNIPLPENIDWRIFANILMAAKMYE